MLDQNIKDQLTSIFEGLNGQFTLQMEVDPLHSAKGELQQLLEEVASCSSKIEVKILNSAGFSFSILRDGVPASMVFRAVPTGHEFTTLLFPDEAVTQRIRSLNTPLLIQSYISLTCTNCPDVVQALNLFSILNPGIRHEIIDGALHREEAEQRAVQAVPAVFSNGELLHVGRAGLGELLEKLEQQAGSNFQPVQSVTKEYDVIVAGGGPAGITAAIYSARKGLRVAVVTDHVGGQLSETLAIDNMISVPGTTGSKLAANLRTHLGDYPVDLLENRKITEVSVSEGKKEVVTSMGETLTAPALIIATGASWRRLNIPGESKYLGSGVAFCAHCDGPFYKGKKVAVIGGGNSGLEAAIDLSGIATDVTVLEFLEEVKGDAILKEKIRTIPNISIITAAESLTVDGDGTRVTGLTYRDRKTEEVHSLALDGVFVQIGLTPNSQVFKDLVEVNRFGEIIIDAHDRTNVPGIYAAGDVTTVPFKQIVIAMGEGSKAALSAFEDRIKNRLG
jgi:alkyl hydroperoxide reductase subunit F